jgi:hypothetical protein
MIRLVIGTVDLDGLVEDNGRLGKHREGEQQEEKSFHWDRVANLTTDDTDDTDFTDET